MPKIDILIMYDFDYTLQPSSMLLDESDTTDKLCI